MLAGAERVELVVDDDLATIHRVVALGAGELVLRAGGLDRDVGEAPRRAVGGEQAERVDAAILIDAGAFGDLARARAAPAEEALDGAGMLAFLDMHRQLHGLAADSQFDHRVAVDAADVVAVPADAKALGIGGRDGEVVVPGDARDRIGDLQQPRVVGAGAVAHGARGADHQLHVAGWDGGLDRRQRAGVEGGARGRGGRLGDDHALGEGGVPEGAVVADGADLGLDHRQPRGLDEVVPAAHAGGLGLPQYLARADRDLLGIGGRLLGGERLGSVGAKGGDGEREQALLGATAIPQRMDARLLQGMDASDGLGVAPAFKAVQRRREVGGGGGLEALIGAVGQDDDGLGLGQGFFRAGQAVGRVRAGQDHHIGGGDRLEGAAGAGGDGRRRDAGGLDRDAFVAEQAVDQIGSEVQTAAGVAAMGGAADVDQAVLAGRLGRAQALGGEGDGILLGGAVDHRIQLRRLAEQHGGHVAAEFLGQRPGDALDLGQRGAHAHVGEGAGLAEGGLERDQLAHVRIGAGATQAAEVAERDLFGEAGVAAAEKIRTEGDDDCGALEMEHRRLGVVLAEGGLARTERSVGGERIVGDVAHAAAEGRDEEIEQELGGDAVEAAGDQRDVARSEQLADLGVELVPAQGGDLTAAALDRTGLLAVGIIEVEQRGLRAQVERAAHHAAIVERAVGVAFELDRPAVEGLDQQGHRATAVAQHARPPHWLAQGGAFGLLGVGHQGVRVLVPAAGEGEHRGGAGELKEAAAIDAGQGLMQFVAEGIGVGDDRQRDVAGLVALALAADVAQAVAGAQLGEGLCDLG